MDGGLRQLFRKNLLKFDFVSIESGSTGGGIPDSNCCVKMLAPCPTCGCTGKEMWIEFKQTEGHVVTLLPEQVGWLMRRHRNGGRVWIAVRQMAPAGPRRAARDALWLVPGALAVAARQDGLQGLAGRPGVRTWHGGPARWDWQAIAQVLVS